MATGFAAQVAKPTCHVHIGEEIDMFCHTCDKRLCSKCAKEKHRSHEWDTLSKTVKEIRIQVLSRCSEVKDTHIPKLQQLLEDLTTAKTEASKKREETIERVNRCKDKIIECVNAKVEEILNFFESENQEVNQNIDKELSVLTKKTDTLKLLIEMFAQSMTSGSDHGIMDLKESLETEINQIKQLDIGKISRSSNFADGMFNTKFIETMLGYIQKKDDVTEKSEVIPKANFSHSKPGPVTVSEQNSFVFRTDNILGISAINETKSWIHRSKETTNELLTTQGKEIQQLDTGTVSDFMVTNDGNTIYTDFDGCKIMKITCTGEKTTLLDTAALHPLGISLSLNGDLLVTILDGWNYKTDTNSKRLLQKMTLTGDITKTYQFDKDTHEKLFTLPYRVCQNYNTDICVVDRPTKLTGQVIILLEDGTVKYRYRPAGTSEFKPTDVACDINCNILISDFNNRIHFLHHSGQFIKFLLTDQEGLGCPSAMCLYNDKLWIGCEDGVIKIFKYDFKDHQKNSIGQYKRKFYDE